MSDHRDQLLDAREIINRNAYLTASQRQTVTGALEAAIAATYPTAAELTSDPRAGYAEFAAEVNRLRDQALAAQVTELAAQRDLARADIAQRDNEITKRRQRVQELRAEVDELTLERDRLRARNTEIEADRIEQARTIETFRVDRDKAVHQLDQATDQLNAIRTILNPDRDNPGDSWVDYVHERAEQARLLRDTPGRRVTVSDTGPRHAYDHDVTEQTPPVFKRWNPDPGYRPDPDELADAMRPRPRLVPLEQLRDQVDGLIAERTPGPRPAVPNRTEATP